MVEHTPPQPEQTSSQSPPTTRCGFVALIGAPNAGKSTLLNQLVGTKLSIVTHKVQTTRTRVRGIVIEGQTQLIFVDTPGIFKPKRRLDRAMVAAAWSGAADADAVVVLVDAARGLDPDSESLLEQLPKKSQNHILALNKVDKVKKPQLLALTEEITQRRQFDAVYMISALKGEGVYDLRSDLASRMPLGPWLFAEDEISDAPMRFLAAEITREKLYLRLHQELPYASTVETTQWQTRPDGSVRIEQTIFVQRESQKKIVLGKGGQTIKQISMAARRELSELLGTTVHLFLFVKVRENWVDDPERYAYMGLDFTD